MQSSKRWKLHLSRLEATLKQQTQQLSVLGEENQALLIKEKALLHAIKGVEGPLALTIYALGAASVAGSAAAAAAATASQCAPELFTSADNHRQQQQGGAVDAAGADTAGMSLRVPYSQPELLLHYLDAREAMVQAVLQQLEGRDDAAWCVLLYTSQLLAKSAADPARAAGILATTKAQRIAYCAEAIPRMALALSKRDPDLALPGHPSPRQDLEAEVDALFERVVVLGLWDPPTSHLQCFMTNLTTGELQAYPEGWWEHVAQAIDPSLEQKAALKLVWQRVKQQSAALGQEYDGLQQRLQQLHESLRVESSSFDRMLQALSALHIAPYAERRACQQPQPPAQQGDSSSVEENPPPLSRSSVTPVQLGAGGCFFAPGSGVYSGQLRESEELLLQGGVDQRGLEAGMVACFNKICVLSYCLILQMANTLSKRQLATMCVQSHPFLFDVLGICEEMEGLGWFDA